MRHSRDVTKRSQTSLFLPERLGFIERVRSCRIESMEIVLMTLLITTSFAERSSDCPKFDVIQRCSCWNSDVTCKDVGASDLNFLRPIPPVFTNVFLTHNTFRVVPAGSLDALANITSLTMQHDWIERFEPGALKALGLLQNLDLSHNKLVEFDLRGIELPLLRSMDLSQNSLLRIKLNPSLKKMTSLTLEANRLTLPEETFAFANTIERLKLSENKVGNDLRFLRNLPSLITLWLSANEISNIPTQTFQRNVKIEYLRLDSNLLRNINFLSDLHNLKGLNLTENNIGDIPIFTFGNMSQLSHLYLENNKLSDIQFIANVSNNLVTLYMSSNSLTHLNPSIVHGKTKMRRLALSHNKLTKLSFVSELPSLEILSVDHNYLSTISKYQFNNTYINILDLSSNNLENIDFVSHSKYLKYLLVPDNKLSGINVNIFQNSKLEELDMSDNVLQNLDFIRNLPSIRNLAVVNTHLSHIPEDIFIDTPFLEKIDLSNNLINNMEFVFYASRLKSLTVNNCSIYSNDDSPLKCSRNVGLSTPKSNITLSFIRSISELWEACYVKSAGPLQYQYSITQWNALTTITVLSLAVLIILLGIIFIETLIRCGRRPRNIYQGIENNVQGVPSFNVNSKPRTRV